MSEFRKYEPSEEEMRLAEESMTDEQMEMTRTREITFSNCPNSWDRNLWKNFNISPDYGLGLRKHERFDLMEYSEFGEDIKRITIEDIEKTFGPVEAQGVVNSDLVIWTDKNVVFVHNYDGWESLRNLPRNPEINQNQEEIDRAKIRFEDSPREGLSKESLWKLYLEGKKQSRIWTVESWRDFYISTDHGGGFYFCEDDESRFDFGKINRHEDEKDEDMLVELITKEEIEQTYGKIEAQGFLDGVITIWTDQNVIYVYKYDGKEWLESYPRNPINNIEKGKYE